MLPQNSITQELPAHGFFIKQNYSAYIDSAASVFGELFLNGTPVEFLDFCLTLPTRLLYTTDHQNLAFPNLLKHFFIKIYGEENSKGLYDIINLNGDQTDADNEGRVSEILKIYQSIYKLSDLIDNDRVINSLLATVKEALLGKCKNSSISQYFSILSSELISMHAALGVFPKQTENLPSLNIYRTTMINNIPKIFCGEIPEVSLDTPSSDHLLFNKIYGSPTQQLHRVNQLEKKLLAAEKLPFKELEKLELVYGEILGWSSSEKNHSERSIYSKLMTLLTASYDNLSSENIEDIHDLQIQTKEIRSILHEELESIFPETVKELMSIEEKSALFPLESWRAQRLPIVMMKDIRNCYNKAQTASELKDMIKATQFIQYKLTTLIKCLVLDSKSQNLSYSDLNPIIAFLSNNIHPCFKDKESIIELHSNIDEQLDKLMSLMDLRELFRKLSLLVEKNNPLGGKENIEVAKKLKNLNNQLCLVNNNMPNESKLMVVSTEDLLKSFDTQCNEILPMLSKKQSSMFPFFLDGKKISSRDQVLALQGEGQKISLRYQTPKENSSAENDSNDNNSI